MVWMTVFHFYFDLQHFRFIQADFYRDPFWTWQRSAIVSLFVLCAGLGQAVASHQGQTWARFWKRWLQIAGCALLVSAASYAMYPQSFIYFGILHGMAVMLVLARALAPWVARHPLPTLVLSALALATPWWAQALHSAIGPAAQLLNTPAWNWLGLISTKPVTEDYAPVLPWMGMMLLGLVLGARGLRQGGWLGLIHHTAPPSVWWRGLAFLGRWSLGYYMLHQPLLIGIVWGASHLLM